MSRYSSQNIKIDESKLEAVALSMLSDHTAPIQRSVTSELFPQQEYTGFGFTYRNCCDKLVFFLACDFLPNLLTKKQLNYLLKAHYVEI